MATINVALAASLESSVLDAEHAYMSTHPGVTFVNITPASSGYLAQAIIDGTARPHVFMSAAQYPMDLVEGAGRLIGGTRFDYLGNELVLISNKAYPTPQINGFGDINANTIQQTRLFIANPGFPSYVPAGRYAQQLFELLGNWTEISAAGPHFDMTSISVTAVLNTVANSDGPAIGAVYYTDALLRVPQVDIIGRAHPFVNRDIIYPVAKVNEFDPFDPFDPADVAATDAFIAFLKTGLGAGFFQGRQFNVLYHLAD